MFSILDQFDLILIYPIFYASKFDLSITNYTLFIFLNIFVFISIFYFLSNYIFLLPSFLFFFFELLFFIFLDLSITQIGFNGDVLFPFMFYIFIFILIANLSSLIPGTLATTSHFFSILFFALSLCLGIFFVGLLLHGFDFLKIFVPRVPFLLIPLMLIIEILSYIIRSFSLAIRLVANIIAGHILLHLFSSAFSNFIFNLIGANFLLSSFLSFIILIFFSIFLFAFTLLEFGVACLQAYVFFTLVSMYMADAVSTDPGH